MDLFTDNEYDDKRKKRERASAFQDESMQRLRHTVNRKREIKLGRMRNLYLFCCDT